MKNSSFLKCMAVFLLTLNSMYANAQSTISQPGYYGLQIGSIELIALSDGTVPVSAMNLFHEAGQPEKVGHLLLQAHLNDPVEVSINAYLIKLADKLILVDAGAGHLFGPAYDMYNGFDFDKQQAVEQRKIAYSEAVKEGYLIAADHISFPGIGRVIQSNDEMIWQPIPYSLLGRTR